MSIIDARDKFGKDKFTKNSNLYPNLCDSCSFEKRRNIINELNIEKPLTNLYDQLLETLSRKGCFMALIELKSDYDEDYRELNGRPTQAELRETYDCPNTNRIIDRRKALKSKALKGLLEHLP